MVFLDHHGMLQHLPTAISRCSLALLSWRTKIDLLCKAVGLECFGDTCSFVRKSNMECGSSPLLTHTQDGLSTSRID
jgi:hypothetical protein